MRLTKIQGLSCLGFIERIHACPRPLKPNALCPKWFALPLFCTLQCIWYLPVSSIATMLQQDVIITLSVCAVIATTVFFEHRMQQVEDKCSRIESKFDSSRDRLEQTEEVDDRKQADTEDTENGRIEATIKRNPSNDLMEDELKELSARKAVAFSVTIGHSLTDNETVSEIVIYDMVEINIGDGYDPTTGIFNVPETGVYAFQWTSVTIPGKWFESELNINGHQKRLNSCNNKGDTASSNLSCTSLVITAVKRGDIVWIAKFGQDGDYLMEMYSSFSGWKIGELSESDSLFI